MNVRLFNIISIVNEGFSDLVMDIALDLGAKGGTIIPVNGSVSPEAMKLYGINVHPEKEIVLIVVNEAVVQKILDRLYDKAGSSSEAMGIFFSLPVTHASENIINQYIK